MGCNLGLELGTLKNLEKPFEFEVSPDTGHYFGFFKSSAPKSRTPESGSLIWVYQPEVNKFNELIAAYLEKDENAKTFWPIVLGASEDYKCLGCFDSPISGQLIEGKIPGGSCSKCPYVVADK